MDSLSLVWYKKGGRPFTGKFILIDSPPGQVDLQWMLEFHFRWYPWEKLAAMFYDRQLGPEMETILAALKSYVEKNT